MFLGIFFIVGCVAAAYFGITNAQEADKEFIKDAVKQTEEDMVEYKRRMDKL